MLTLNQLHLSSFLSHENTQLTFNLGQKLLISGKSGAGKSAVIDAVVWGLYGRGRSDNRSLIRRGSKLAKVAILLGENEQRTLYKIERTVNNEGKQELRVYEKTADSENFKSIKIVQLRDLQEYLEKEILHSSYLLFINSIIFPQDNTENFIKQPASRRKDLILEMVNAEKYDGYYLKIKDKLMELENKKIQNQSMITNLIESNQADEILAKNLEKLTEENKEFEEQLEKIEKQLKENQVLEMQMSIAMTKIQERENQINALNSSLVSSSGLLQKMKDNLEKINTEFSLNYLKEKEQRIEELKKLEKELFDWNEEKIKLLNSQPLDENLGERLKEINQELINLLGQKIEFCPELNKECVVVARERNKRIELLESEIKSLNEKKDNYIKAKEIYLYNLEELEKRKPQFSHEETETLEKEITKIKNSSEDRKKIETGIQYYNAEVVSTLGQIKKLFAEIEKLKEVLVDTDKIRIEQKALNTDKYRITNYYNNNLHDLTIAGESDKRLKNNKEKIAKLEKDSEELTEQIESFELLKEAFGQKGIKAILTDYIIPRLEAKINEILDKLSDFRIQLDTQKSGVSKDTTLEGLFINIANERGEISDYSLFSGGEKIKINTAICEGLASVQRCNFRCFDENIIGLDAETIDSFTNIMLQLQKDIDQIICISHLQSVKDLFNEKIEIIKINGVSKII